VNGKTKQAKTNKKGEYYIHGAKKKNIVMTGAIMEGMPAPFIKGERKGKANDPAQIR
jgi:hypothetical protein